MPGIPASDHRIRKAALAALGPRGLTSEELAIELRRAGVDLGPDGVDRLERVLDESTEFVDLDARWLGVRSTLDGTRWITAVDAEGAEHDLLALNPDLTLFGWWAIDADLTIAGTGGSLEVDDERADFLSGPRGWLEPYAGATLEVRVAGTELHLSRAGVLDPSPAMVAAIRAAFAERATAEELRGFDDDDLAVDLTQASLDDVLWHALASDQIVFRAQPIPPVDALLAAAGLERDSYAVLRTGFDRDALQRWRRRSQLAREYGLEDDQVDRAEIAIGMSLAALAGEPDALGPPEQLPGAAMMLAVALDDPIVCEVMVAHHVERGTPPAELATFAETIVAHLPAGEGAGPRWLAGRALALGREPQRAMVAFEDAVATGDEHPLALIALAGFRSDAGDAPGAVSLLRKAGIEPEADEEEVAEARDAFELLKEVWGFSQLRPRAPVGRNDPCPCGSGRKYKACHLGQERHDLADRGAWLYAKARRYVKQHDPALIDALAVAVYDASGSQAALADLLDSSLVADIALREGEIDISFAADRDALLPDDETVLAARWQHIERSLFEVEQVGKTSLRMRDLRAGEQITVTHMTPHAETRVGDLMLGRPLPLGDTWRVFSGLVKVVALRDEVLSALETQDPFLIADLVGRCLAPPEVHNTDGDPMEWHEITWKLPDPETARAALAAHDALTASHDTYRLVRDTAGQRDTVILTLTIAGDELRGEVNSAPRADEVLALVAELVPAAELIDHDRRTADEMRKTRRDEQAAPRHLPDNAEPADGQEDLAHRLERQWLDEQVPALGGMTPREAAADPIARHDLERLLDGFEGRDGLMDIGRLRAALDL